MLLAAYREHQGKPGDTIALFTVKKIESEKRDLAKALRADLQAVGVTRAMRFGDTSPNVDRGDRREDREGA